MFAPRQHEEPETPESWEPEECRLRGLDSTRLIDKYRLRTWFLPFPSSLLVP